MASVEELKEIIIKLKMELVNNKIPKGHCPYTYYTALSKRMKDCDMDCIKCREKFMVEMERYVRKNVEEM